MQQDPLSKTLAFGRDEAAPAEDPSVDGPDPLLGSHVGSFRIVRLLGRGGMGTVYLAEHPVIGSRVAIKFLHESMSSEPAVVARFYDEARAVNLIGHENIVGIYDLNVLPPNRYYFVMEYLDGETLEALEQRGRVEPGVALDVLCQLCDALQCAHDHGVVHRDLKPENVFLVTRGGKAHFVKVVDFGIAKLRGATRPAQTQAGLIVGTPEYMAPEQCEDRAVDARTDIYALGVIAFELATGRLPFTGRTVPQLLLAHLRERPPRPSELAPVAPALERVILRALEKDPAARFPDMASFAEALRGAATARAPHATAPAPSVLVPDPPASPAPESALQVEVRAGPAAAVRHPVAELTRGGLFLRADSALPPLLSRVSLALAHPSLRAVLEVSGEVVRHVSPAEARAWRMAPGFAVQLVDLTPAARAALATVADAERRDTPAPAPVPMPAVAAERLASLEARTRNGHYALLGLAPDAEFSDVRRAVRALRADLEAIRTRPLAPDHPARATALLARVEAAAAAVGTPASRLAYDAARGNHRGIARCVSAGVPSALVAARRRELLAAEPGRAADAGRQLARAQVARKLGNVAAALAAYEAALAADPLDLATHEAYTALKGGAAPRE